MPQSSLLAATLAGICVALTSTAVVAKDCCDPTGPFALGEGPITHPATCDTMASWLERAPETPGRISMAIRGELTAIGADEALAYLIMCRPSEIQVMCVTYGTGDFRAGDVAVFAGGFSRAGDRQTMLDPCLASPVD